MDPTLLDATQLPWVTGQRPTPHGVLAVALNLTAGRFAVETVPVGTQGSLVLPGSATTLAALWRQAPGEACGAVPAAADLLWSLDGPRVAAGDLSARVDDGRVVVGPVVRPEVFCTRVRPVGPPVGEAAASTSVPVAPRAQVLARDVTTQGRWQGKYGSIGYVLFNYNCTGAVVTAAEKLCNLTGTWIGRVGRPAVTVQQTGSDFIASAAGMCLGEGRGYERRRKNWKHSTERHFVWL